MDRRRFLRSTATTGAAAGFGPGFWQAAFAAPAAPGPGPYGELGPSNLDDMLLPAGFTARVVAVGGLPVGLVQQDPSLAYLYPLFPDGTATYPLEGGGWALAVNSEVPRSSALRVALGVPVDVQSGGCSSIQIGRAHV